MAAIGLVKQNMARKAEKALKEILDKADNNLNGKVGLKEFTHILEANGVELSDEDLKEFAVLADDAGEISKTDLIVQTKASKFWKGYMEAKSKPGALMSKVNILIINIIVHIHPQPLLLTRMSEFSFVVFPFSNVRSFKRFSSFEDFKSNFPSLNLLLILEISKNREKRSLVNYLFFLYLLAVSVV